MPPPAPAHRLTRISDIGHLVAEGRRHAKLSQEEFASRVGISRKTLSDLERGVAEHVSLKTVLKALSLAGFVLEASRWRPPTLSEVMAQRAEYQTRVDEINASAPTTADASIPARPASSSSRRARRK